MKTIVLGWLNTDLVIRGVEQIPGEGGYAVGKELRIGPGGKPRNIANMIAHLSDDGVAMVGRSVKDSYGLWEPPVTALKNAGVNTDFVQFSENPESSKFPGIALITVDKSGNNQIIVAPGASNEFSTDDIDSAKSLFQEVGGNNGSLVFTMECPLETAVYAAKIANELNIKIFFDPGGIEAGQDISELLDQGFYLIKPNEHEAKILTGIDVVDLESAEEAGGILLKQGAENVLITAGANGAYLITNDNSIHIPAPKIESEGEKDETGSGDQTMAAVCAFIEEGRTLEKASRLAVLAGTLQFHRAGIKSISKSEILNRANDQQI